MRDLRTLPKAHLHLHLDGALRRGTLHQVCDELGSEAPHIPAAGTYRSFSAFMDVITACHDALSTPDALGRIVAEIVEDAADDGAVWVEVSLWPGLFGGRLGPEAEAVRLVLDAGHRAARRIGIGFGVMLAANRHEGPGAAGAVADLAVALAGEGVVSFGLDGDEAAFPPAAFAPAFAVARAGGVLCTPHAGELLGADSVAVALDLLGADRILHGVRAIEDEDLVRRLASSPVCLDVCPTSNAGLGVFRLEDHPLAQLLAAGVRCSVNADDPLLFGSGLVQEYELCRERFGLSDQVLATVAGTSLECSGAPPEIKARGSRDVEAWLRSPAGAG